MADSGYPGLADEIRVTPEFERALDRFERGDEHLFITGCAGTGKSTLLKLLRETTGKSIAVVAPTGAAAINVGGQTLHSFFRFPPRPPAALRIEKYDSDLYSELDALIIDEISMVRADMLDAVDRFLRVNGRSPNLPFGGVQLVMFGDLCQLPPVVGAEAADQYIVSRYGAPYFFAADVFRGTSLATIELQDVFRQSDPEFVAILNGVRAGEINDAQLRRLNTRVDTTYLPYPEDMVVLLTPTNAVARRENERRLAHVDGAVTTFVAAKSGRFVGVAENNLPVPSQLHLKVGANVLFVRNDRDRRWVNGSVGTVLELEDDAVRISIAGERKRVVWVEPESWEMQEFVGGADGGVDAQRVGKLTQIPLRLGYALTIHKSQGRTLDRAIIDMGSGAFASGQTYVALSRVRAMDGLTLLRPITRQDISVDPVVTSFLTQGVVPDRPQGQLWS